MEDKETFKYELENYLAEVHGLTLTPVTKKLIDEMVNIYGMIISTVNSAHTHTISNPLDIYNKPCPMPDYPVCGVSVPKAIKKEQEMASYAHATVVNEASIEAGQREFVRDTLRKAHEAKKDQFRKDFGLVDDDEPRTPADLVKRITDGQYTIDAKHVDEKTWGCQSAVGYIRWRDPKIVEDKAGYEAAKTQLAEAYETAKTAAMLRPVAELEKVIEDFKGFTLS
jgi:hypothetical protein